MVKTNTEVFINSFLDFYTGTFLASTLFDLEEFVKFLAKKVNSRSYKSRYAGSRGKRYEHCWREPDELFCLHAISSKDKVFDSRLELRGQYLRHFNYSQQLGLILEIQEKFPNFSPTRIDCTFDDYKKRFSYSEVKLLAEQELYAPAKTFHYHESGGKSFYKNGESISFGNRTSDKTLIFYDSDYVHQIPADRWELTLRREFAQVALDNLISKTYVNPAYAVIGNFVLFDKQFGNIHPLWQDLCDEILENSQPLTIKLNLEPTSLEANMAHIRDKYSASFADIRDCLGDQFPEFMERLDIFGNKRQDRKHKARVAKYKLQSGGKAFDLDKFFQDEIESEEVI